MSHGSDTQQAVANSQIDTTLQLPFTDEQLKQYERDGYLVYSQGCSPDLIHAFNSHIYSIRSAEKVADWANPWLHREVNEKDRYSLRLFNPHLHDGFSVQMMKLPVIRGGLYQLLGDEAVGVQSMYFYKDPGTKGQAAHQDYYYIRNEPNTMIAAWVAMDDTDEENGCLWVIPGSQKLGLLPHGAVKNLLEHEATTHETEGVDLTKEIPVRLKRGDILFFHNLLIHSSTRNQSKNRWRRSYVCHYVRHDSTVEREDLRKKFALI